MQAFFAKWKGIFVVAVLVLGLNAGMQASATHSDSHFRYAAASPSNTVPDNCPSGPHSIGGGALINQPSASRQYSDWPVEFWVIAAQDDDLYGEDSAWILGCAYAPLGSGWILKGESFLPMEYGPIVFFHTVTGNVELVEAWILPAYTGTAPDGNVYAGSATEGWITIDVDLQS